MVSTRTSDKRVLLKSVEALTFYNGELTTHRRTSAVPQLTCQGAPCRVYQPDVVQCYNRGGSGSEIQWKCEADLPSSLRLGKVQVSCEGWDHADDPHILKGSCGLEFSLKRTDPDAYGSQSSGLAGKLFWLAFLAVAAFILYPLFRSIVVSFLPFLNRFLPGGGDGGGGGGGTTRRPGFGGGTWGGGRGDAPPPYTPRPGKPSAAPESTGWRPGFWTGAATGAAASRLFGRPDPRPSVWDFDRSPFGARPASTGAGWFGGGQGGAGPVYRGQGSSRDLDGDNMGPIRSSTGYGGTRNR